MGSKTELKLLINSRYPLIYIETWEEQRVEELLQQVATELEVMFFIWTVTTGLIHAGTDQPIYDTADPMQALGNIGAMRTDGIYLLKDFHRYLEQDPVLRKLRDIAVLFREHKRSIVISAPVMNIPLELQKDVASFQLSLPDRSLLRSLARQTFQQLSREHRVKQELDDAGLDALAGNLSGLTLAEAQRVVTRAVLERMRIDAKLIEDVTQAKREIIRREGVLEFFEKPAGFTSVGGLACLKEWLEKRRGASTPEAAKFGLDPPKGILIMGVQGCGKSLCAKAVAKEWALSLLKLDAGTLYDKFIGESEKKLRQSLRLAESLAPVVLWIDEIEKGFAATTSGADVDAGLSQRILATFLSWLQEKKSPVFVVATSNNVSALPPELLRKGRFDEIFFVDLPREEERREIFRIHLQQRARDPEQFDLDSLAAATECFSGAEIEQAIVAALYSAFSAKQQLTTELILAEVKKTYPLAVTRREDVEALRDWARGRTVPAA